MKLYFLMGVLLLSTLFFACKKVETPKNPEGTVHKVEALEVVDVTSYTYIRVNENGTEYWLAGPKMQAQKGTTYYYTNGMEMKNFQSPELKKTFESVIFVQELSTMPPAGAGNTAGASAGKQPQKPALVKESLTIDKVSGGVSIAELLENLKKYENKIIRIKGKVTKVNNAIMGKNWAHIQDGTDFKGDFDLTATTTENVNVGDIVVFEGKIILDKDFGYGYSYKVLLEDAKIKK